MKRLALIAFCVAASGAAQAGEICYGPAMNVSGEPTASTVFACPTAGSHTIDALAALGWRVVKLTTVSLGGAQTAAQLVLKRARDGIFANGFDA